MTELLRIIDDYKMQQDGSVWQDDERAIPEELGKLEITAFLLGNLNRWVDETEVFTQALGYTHYDPRRDYGLLRMHVHLERRKLADLPENIIGQVQLYGLRSAEKLMLSQKQTVGTTLLFPDLIPEKVKANENRYAELQGISTIFGAVSVMSNSLMKFYAPPIERELIEMLVKAYPEKVPVEYFMSHFQFSLDTFRVYLCGARKVLGNLGTGIRIGSGQDLYGPICYLQSFNR